MVEAQTKSFTPGKGLGWIADNPDQRDYSLQRDVSEVGRRLSKEQTTSTIEALAEQILAVLDSIKIEDRDINKNAKAAIETLRRKALGDLEFAAIKVYRQIRLDSMHDQSIYNRQTLLNLKLFLYLLVQDELILLEKETDEIDAQTFQIFQSFQQTLDWLKSNNEKDLAITENLVRKFQRLSEIAEDGSVSFETYTKLIDFEENPPEELSSPQIAEMNARYSRQDLSTTTRGMLPIDPKPVVPTYPDKGYKPVARLIPVPGLLPNREFFQKLVDILGTRSAKKDGPGNKNLVQDKYSRIWTEDKNVATFVNQGNPVVKIIQEEVFPGLTELLEGKGKSLVDLVEEMIINSEDFDLNFSGFRVVEPLVTVVLSGMAPLSQYREGDLSKLVETIFQQFEQRLTTNTLFPLELMAIRYVDELLKNEIKFLIYSNPKTPDLGASASSSDVTKVKQLRGELSFLMLAAQFIQYCIDLQDLQDMPKTEGIQDTPKTEAQTKAIFDKEEVFQIVLPPTKKVSDPSDPKIDSEPNDLETNSESIFFQTPELQIPILGSFMRSYQVEQEQDQSTNSGKPLFLFLPSVVDLSFWCSDVRDQGLINSCTAFAAIGLLEYFTNRSQGKYIEVSPLFLYKVTRKLMDLNFDSGASLRETMKAMSTFGVPPESYYPYDEQKVNDDPPQFCYALAERYQALKYFRLDYPGLARKMLVFQIKAVLAAGFPCVFGLTLYESCTKYESTKNPQTIGHIPVPEENERVIGGHAMVVVGYDDYREIDGVRGAFLVRNSKGPNWGKAGYGWLPYGYVIKGHTADWWSLLKAEWLAESTLGLGANNFGGGKLKKNSIPGY